METTKKLSENIHIVRMSRGYTQENMASMLGMTRKTYGLIESGAKRPDYETFQKIAGILKISTECLESFDIEFHLKVQSLFCKYYSTALPKEKILNALQNRLKKNFSKL